MKKLLEKIQQQLDEAIPLSLAKKYQKYTYSKEEKEKEAARKAEGKKGSVHPKDWQKTFQSWFGNDENGKPRYRVIIPLGGKESSTRKSLFKPNQKILDLLNKLGYKVDDVSKYGEGKASRKEGKGEVRIGSLFETQIKKLKRKEEGDPEWKVTNGKKGNAPQKLSPEEEQLLKDLQEGRKVLDADIKIYKQKLGGTQKEEEGGGADAYFVVISRHPYDWAGQSTDRGWSSCQRITSLSTGSPHRGRDKKPTKWVYTEPVKDCPKFDPLNPTATSRELAKNFVQSSPGEYYWGVKGGLEEGHGLIAYLVPADEIYKVKRGEKTLTKIKLLNPVLRYVIKPYYNTEGTESHLFVTNRVYSTEGGEGKSHEKLFKRTVEDWLESKQGGGYGKTWIGKFGSGSRGEIHTPGFYKDADYDKSERTPEDPTHNKQNVKEFKDGLKWETVMEHFKWFAKSKYEDAVIGFKNNEFTFYSGTWQDGIWEEGNFVGGTWIDGAFQSGRFENAKWHNGQLAGGTIKNSKIDNINFGRARMVNCEVESADITGGYIGEKTKISNAKINIPVEQGNVKIENSEINELEISGTHTKGIQLIKTKISNGNDLSGTFDSCILGNVTFSKNVVLKGTSTFDGLKMDGGEFDSGIVKNAKMKNVHIKSIVLKSGTLENCVIEHGRIENGILKNCQFKGGKFFNGRFFGGKFESGSFRGGDFVSGEFGKDAKWYGGKWHGKASEKPKSYGKEHERDLSPEEKLGLHKSAQLKNRLTSRHNYEKKVTNQENRPEAEEE